MRYYVITDPHSYYTLVRAALEEKGFFTDPEPHKLIICGDLLDRGPEPLEMVEFVISLIRADQLIFIRGNHEDLMDILLDTLERARCGCLSSMSRYTTTTVLGNPLSPWPI